MLVAALTLRAGTSRCLAAPGLCPKDPLKMAYYNSDAPTRAARLLKIVTLVAGRRSRDRMSRERLADACGCTIKTIQRDIVCLQEAQIPIEYDSIARSYSLPSRGWTFPVAQMTATDALALAMARGLLLNTASPLPFASEIHAALEKITSSFSPGLQALMESAAASFVAVEASTRNYSDAPIGLLLEAIGRHETIEMRYDSRSSQTCERRRVDPYRLDRREGCFFELQAWCHRRGQVRTFALDRISQVAMTGETFTPRDWDSNDDGVVGGLRGGEPVRVQIRFDAAVAPYARERRWGFATQFDELADGSLVMSGTVRGTEGIVRELLTWQRYAHVLGGPEVVRRMTEEAHAIASLYGLPWSPPPGHQVDLT